MLAAIHFDNDFSSRTVEIDDEIADVLLSIELIILDLFSADSGPKMQLSVGHLFSEYSSVVLQASIEWKHPVENPPCPPLQRGGEQASFWKKEKYSPFWKEGKITEAPQSSPFSKGGSRGIFQLTRD
jgi:hypothetical protein